MSSNPSKVPGSTRVLVVDDDERQRTALRGILASFGYFVVAASDGEEALDLHAEQPADVILTDLVMPRMDGYDLLRTLEARGDRTPAIVLTAFGSIEKAISIVHDFKAFWFLEKPVQPAVLHALVDRAIAHAGLVEETGAPQPPAQSSRRSGRACRPFPRNAAPYFRSIIQVAPTSASVLDHRRKRHRQRTRRPRHPSPESRARRARSSLSIAPPSPRRSSKANCLATRKARSQELWNAIAGCFEQADKGTVLLDEIGDMPIGTQAKLLRVLEDRKVRRLGGQTDLPVDVRLIAATNKVAEDAIKGNSCVKISSIV